MRAVGLSECRWLGLAGALLSAGTAGCTGTPADGGAAVAAGSAGRFVDVAAQAGIRYEWRISGPRPLNILQTIGNGGAFLDFNNDGALDVLLVGARPALFEGDGRGHFRDVTASAGLDALSGHFLGCAVGDVDGDGWSDLYLSGYREARLLKNRPAPSGRRRFEDVTRTSGLPPIPWGTSAIFVETIPGSGRLDLYVCNYADFGPNTDPQLCPEGEVMTACGPRYYRPLRGFLFRNDGRGRFTDITATSGATDVNGRGLGVAAARFDDSDRPGIAIANDEMPGDLLQPVGRGSAPRFRNIGETSGTAYDRDGNVHGGMGIDWGDYDNDGALDLFVATFQNEAKSLYRNEGGGVFSDIGIAAGVGMAAAPYVAFGCKFFDYDNDGWLDLAIANGHVQDNIAHINPNATYRQATQLFHNTGGPNPRFEDVSHRCGPDLVRPIVGRGLATGDWNNDGRVDLLIVDSEGAPLLLRNETPAAGHWLGLHLIGTRCNRNGYGAVVTVEAGGKRLVRQCQAGGSYLSASDPRVHFGLGTQSVVERVVIDWPGGPRQVLSGLQVDRYHTVRQPARP